jgi:4-amino-4-deoxy-L-arabinose transferase-like glycosyltransferase
MNGGNGAPPNRVPGQNIQGGMPTRNQGPIPPPANGPFNGPPGVAPRPQGGGPVPPMAGPSSGVQRMPPQPGGPAGNPAWGPPPGSPLPAGGPGGNPGWNQQRGPMPPQGGPGGNPAWGPPPGSPMPMNAPAANMPGVLSPQQSAQPLGMEDGQAIIYRTPNFYLRSAYRPGVPLASLRRPSGHTRMQAKVMPKQGARVASSETSMMPVVELAEDVKAKKSFNIPIPNWLEITVVLIALVGALVAHAYNMFYYPRYELDEGTYMSSAWAIWNGMITPYAYGYGHPPLGWMQIAAGLPLVGGFFTFGDAINTGRVLMLFYAVGSSLLVYLIVRRMIGSRSAGLLAMVVFSFSPLAVAFQRQVFLDNIGTFWILLSVYLLIAGNSRLRYTVFSAIALGIAFLSKEVLALFIPVMIFAVWIYSTKFQRKFSMVAFTYTVIAVCSGFVLMAVLKGELFPDSGPLRLPWDHSQHLSMIGTYLTQAARGSNEGDITTMWGTWMSGDFILMIASIVGPVLNLIMGIWNRKQLVLALLAASFWLLLVRGGVVLSFYIIPLIPFIAINLAVALNAILKAIARLFYFDLMRSVLLLFATVLLIPYYLFSGSYIYTLKPASIQNQAITWMRAHAAHNSVIIANSWADMDLRLPGGQGVGNEASFPNTLVYVNVDDDPTVYHGVLDGNPDRIDYFVADSEVLTYITGDPQGKPQGVDPSSPDKLKWQGKLNQLYSTGLDVATSGKLLMQAFFNSQKVATFKAQDHGEEFEIDIFQVIHQTPLPEAKITSPPAQPNTATALTNPVSPMAVDRRTIIS